MTRSAPSQKPARSRRNPLLIGGVVAMAVITGLLASFVLLRQPQAIAADPSPTPSPSVPASPEPSEEPSLEPTPSEEPSETPAPQPTDDPAPTPTVQAPDGILPPGSTVRVIVDELRLRAGPTVEAMVLATVSRDQLVTIQHTFLNPGFGPIEADGYTWYPVSLVESDMFMQNAWAAVGDGSTAFVELVAPLCPDDDVVDLATLEVLNAWSRVACFGDRPITTEGVFGCGGCGGSIPGTFEPWWLASPMNYNFLSTDPSAYVGPFVLHFGPTSPASPDVGAIVRVTGHFNDATSAECVVATGIEGEQRSVDPAVAELYCRSQFVVDSYEVIGTDADFPFS